MRIKIFLSFFPFSLLAACGPSDSATPPDTTGITLRGTSKQGLLLTTTQDYKSSRLFYFDFASGTKSEVFAGESGDPALFKAGGDTFFFNRTAESSNLRRLTREDGNWDIGTQIAIPGAGVGDPQDVLALDDRYLLMSFWTANSLGIFDRQQGKLTQTVSLPFDVGNEETHVFRPSSLFKSQTGQPFVVHQGLAGDGMTLTGQQQIFSLNWDGATLSADDLDPDKENIQGIRLQVSNPTNALPSEGSVVLITGSCTVYSGTGCKSGFERVDLVAGTTEMVWDMSDLPERHNGAVVPGDGQIFFAQMLKPGADQTLASAEKFLARLDPATKSLTRVHNYPADSNGCCSLFYDETSQHLLAPDYSATAGGSISVVDAAGQVTAKTAVDNTPYNGLMISQ